MRTAVIPSTHSNLLSQIKIIMVGTTLPANIGAAARALKTMGLSHLVLVNPKTFPSPEATALAAGAADVLAQIEVFTTLEQAIADCTLVFATSARHRSIPWPLLEARQATKQAIEILQNNQQQRIAIVFGREAHGLSNEELSLANYHLTIPVNPEYGVLNVAQAIQVVCYELRMQWLEVTHTNPLENFTPEKRIDDWETPVDQAAMQQFYPHLEKTLVDIGFLDPDNPRLLPLRLKRLFGRIQLDKMEYNLLRGVFSRVQLLVKENVTHTKNRTN